MQTVMSEECSVFRNRQGLVKALEKIRTLKKRGANVGLATKGRRFNYELEDALELLNMLKAAETIVFSALQRTESRGSHFRTDHPERNDLEGLKHSLVYASKEGLTVRYKPVAVTKYPPEKRTY